MIERISRSVEQTMAIGEAIARTARPRDIIALHGELGAGKTQLVRGLARGLGLDPAVVSSPTFVLMHEYAVEEQAAAADDLVLVHIDAYRLRGPGELDTLGWGDELLDGAVVAIEWAQRVADGLGKDRLDVHLTHGADHRLIRLTGHGNWTDRLPALDHALEGLT